MDAKYKKPAPEELKKRLTPQQYDVTQQNGTEAPFKNEYWNKKDAGIYVDVVTGEPLFSSIDKYDSGSGWPSFTQPLDANSLKTLTDAGTGSPRTEVRSKLGDTHLGHVFDDGPGPTGQRFCVNSSSLRFIPTNKLKDEGYATATLAGGCFWGMEDILRKIPGVVETRVGYTGGSLDKPSYEQVKKGNTGHTEAIEVTFDPKKVSYEEILGLFFRMHDPTTKNRQGNDIGSQYRSVVFYHGADQKKIAESVKARVQVSGKWKSDLVTELVPAGSFYPAEEYHQGYLQKHPGGYSCHYLRD